MGQLRQMYSDLTNRNLVEIIRSHAWLKERIALVHVINRIEYGGEVFKNLSVKLVT